MSQAYNLFKSHAPAALASNDSAAALALVNDPEGVDLAGTEHDQPRKWAWFRDAVGNEAAITVRAAVEKIVAAKPDNPTAETATAYMFAANAQAILSQLDSVGISPCDEELRRALRTIIQVETDVADEFTKALRTGYQSPAQSVLGRDATAEDFAEAREELATVQQVEQGVEYNLRALQLSVNLTADGRKNVSCRVTPVAIVNGSQVKSAATAFSNQTPVNAKQQALINAVLAAVDSYLES